MHGGSTTSITGSSQVSGDDEQSIQSNAPVNPHKGKR
ncbi:hypothetical protein ABIE27_004660 [Paenibacillus sp. 4624]